MEWEPGNILYVEESLSILSGAFVLSKYQACSASNSTSDYKAYMLERTHSHMYMV